MGLASGKNVFRAPDPGSGTLMNNINIAATFSTRIKVLT
jgi:hypothetical protein